MVAHDRRSVDASFYTNSIRHTPKTVAGDDVANYLSVVCIDTSNDGTTVMVGNPIVFNGYIQAVKH